jgi:hypothetical protein
MSFLGRTVLLAAVIGVGLTLFRKDITRLLAVLRKPAQNFVQDVKKELDAGNLKGLATKTEAGASAAVGRSAEDAKAAAEAVRNATEKPATATAEKELK